MASPRMHDEFYNGLLRPGLILTGAKIEGGKATKVLVEVVEDPTIRTKRVVPLLTVFHIPPVRNGNGLGTTPVGSILRDCEWAP